MQGYQVRCRYHRDTRIVFPSIITLQALSIAFSDLLIRYCIADLGDWNGVLRLILGVEIEDERGGRGGGDLHSCSDVDSHLRYGTSTAQGQEEDGDEDEEGLSFKSLADAE